jgi:hypothetical protein
MAGFIVKAGTIPRGGFFAFLPALGPFVRFPAKPQLKMCAVSGYNGKAIT